MSGSYASYPQYTKAKIEWADSLPEAWEHIRLRWGASIYAGGTPSKTNLAFWENGTVPWLNSGSVNQGLIQGVSAFITKAALQSSSARWIKRGSLVVALAGQGKTKGMVAQLDIDATCNQSMAAIVPTAKLQPRFLLWWLTSNYQNIRNMAGGNLRDGLNLQLLGDIQCPLPSLLEQAQIAKFLDYETAVIDALIEKQQQLITLLKEKRQAVISHAVTKGLNPNAPLRPSGIEWLGQVPAHWELPRIGYVARVFNGSTPSRAVPHYWVEEGVPWISSGKVNEDIVREPTSWISKRALAECSIELAPKGSVIVGMIGQGKTRATSAMLGIDSTINQNMAAIVAGGSLDSRYLYRALTAAYDDLRLLGRGANQPALNCDILRAYRIPHPPLEEQQAIAEYTEDMLQRTGRTMELAAQQGELLQKRRTALISAAVTGKIDVRGWQPPQSTSAAEAT